MDLVASAGAEARFASYVEGLAGVIGHVDRVRPLRDYCLGLLMPGERKSVEPMAAIERHEPINVWMIDDTGFPKKGEHSVGVGRQYCGQLGKQDNCQVAVSLSIANHHASLPVAYRLYLPQDWAQDEARREKAKVPPQIRFKTKPEIALDQLRWAREAGIAPGVVLMDPAYGNDAALRTQISA